MAVNKVEYGGDTLIDLTGDSVTSQTLAEGETAHNAAGEEITGTLKVQDEIVTTTGTGAAYEATVRGITELKNGVSFIMIPHTTNTTLTPQLNVNNLGAKMLCRGGSSTRAYNYTISSQELVQNKAYLVMYTGGVWQIVNCPVPEANELSGRVPVDNGGVPSTNVANKGKVLTINSSGKPEWQTPTGGGDTSNLATVDKIASIDTSYGQFSDKRIIYTNQGEGISFVDKFSIEDTSGNEVSEGQIWQRLPIDAGENVTFTVDEENKIVKINTIGGGSSNNLPNIRFVGCRDIQNTMNLEQDNPISFIVENMGGGTLQVGDKLQICVRRTSWYKHSQAQAELYGATHYRKQKLRKKAEYIITEDDIGHRFLNIKLHPQDDNAWLFHNDSTRSGSLSPMYFRLKRVTKYGEDGTECDAIFSNVVTVWKSYDRETQHITIN